MYIIEQNYIYTSLPCMHGEAFAALTVTVVFSLIIFSSRVTTCVLLKRLQASVK